MENLDLTSSSTATLIFTSIFVISIASLVILAQQLVYNLRSHPLAGFPGPKAAAATRLWKAYVECIIQRPFRDELATLHDRYGKVVRVGPNELHFANPQAYHDIYNQKNRWDKEESLYHSFGEDRSSFGYLTFQEARERREIVGRMLSAAAMQTASGLILEKVIRLCDAIKEQNRNGNSVDLNYAYRCFTMDVITYLCFGQSANALDTPDFKAPIVEAMDASTPVFVRFKHADWYKSMIMNCPPNISRIVSPATKGLVDLQQILKKQISRLTEDPSTLEHLLHNMTVYHQLLNPDSYSTKEIPSAGSLYEESQALMFGGGDTAGHTLMVGTFHLIQKQPSACKKLQEELREAWPNLDEPPSLRSLEKLPYLNAVIREALRMNSGVVSGLARVVPEGGATIDGISVPGKTIVSCGSTFVHWDPSVFPDPYQFKPERWLGDSNLEKSLVAFSKGPRACLGMNLAWAEMRLCLAHIFRKFNIRPNPSNPQELVMREAFLPFYYGPHIWAEFVPLVE